MSKGSFNKLISSEKPVLIDFYATWCGPCKMLSPIIKEIKEDFGDKIRVIKIDVDKNATLSKKLEIMSMPTLMIFKEGKNVWRTVGIQTKTAIALKIKESLAAS